MSITPSRNAPCPCGSGKKYKHCCADKVRASGPSPAELNQLAALFGAGRHAELEALANRLLESKPAHGLVWKLLCIARQMQGKDELHALQQAAKYLPDDAEVQNNLANLLQARGQAAEGVTYCRRAVELRPDFVEAHATLGNALKDLGQFDEAIACYRRALELAPDFAEIHSNLGALLHELLRMDEAEASLRRALEINPNYAAAHNNLGNVLRDKGASEAAITSFRQAIQIDPNDADTYNNLGAVLRIQGEFDEAIACHRRAITIQPNYSTAHNNLSHLLLERGDFEAGWHEYVWREARNAAERRVPTPIPQAKSLLPFSAAGKRILLCHEQGIGDELFFLRFAPQLREQTSWLGYWSTPKVHGLIDRSGCVDQVLTRYEESPDKDLVIPVGDLPLLLGCNSTAAIPPSLRFSPTPEAQTQVRQRLQELGLNDTPLLGLTWRGGTAPIPGKTKMLFKQIELKLLAEAVQDWPGAIVVLQRNPEPDEIERLRTLARAPVHDFSEYNDDLEGMLALLDELKEYVGVSNANMHLMAGLGKTARVLIPFPAEWRWMNEGETSPWFPGFSLYRQSVGGDWQETLSKLSANLKALHVDSSGK